MPEKLKVLIVEDEFILYQELCEFFEDKGFDVIGNDEDKAVDNYDDAVKLTRQYEPDIAVLDIKIKGAKDGIDLGAFIRKHYEVPVIYLSAFNNYVNLERVRQTGADGFVIKASKPLDKTQLWTTVQLALPLTEKKQKRKRIGEFFRVKEMTISKDSHKQRIMAKEPDDPVEIKTFIKWNDIVFIETYNNKTAGGGNNNMLIHPVSSGKAYMLHGSLNEVENQLPDYFIRFDQSTIVNPHHITGQGKTVAQYFSGDLLFRISDTYRKKALEKIELYLGLAFKDFPES